MITTRAPDGANNNCKFVKKPCANSKVNARLLVLVHVVLELRLPELVEGDNDEGYEDVDKEERKDNEEDDIEDALLGSKPGDRALIFISGGH